MNAPRLPDNCKGCNKVCLGSCKDYKARDAYFSHPVIRERLMSYIVDEPVNTMGDSV